MKFLIGKYDILRHMALAAALTAAVSGLNARTLTPSEALARLTEGDMAHKAPGLSIAAPELMQTVSTTDGRPAVYIFADSDNCLFVSADDAAEALLGYCDDHNATGTLPPQLQWWMSQYAEQIAAIADMPQEEASQPARASSRIDADTEPIAPLVTTRWDQGEPFNNSCPSKGGQHAVTGCVATAMAQLMNYFEYPERGTGTGDATFQGSSVSMSLSQTLQWNLMADSYHSNYSKQQAQAVATLMATCGYAVHMMYGLDQSGAYDSHVETALLENFGYDENLVLLMRDGFTRSEWTELVYANLANIGPLYYSGNDGSAGHAFVCDGYSRGMFHFNWGWGGSYDGYFRLDALKPDGQGTGGNAGGFNNGQMAIFGMCRPGEYKELPFPEAKFKHREPVTAYLAEDALTISGQWAYSGDLRGNHVEIALEMEPLYGESLPAIYVPVASDITSTSEEAYSRVTVPNFAIGVPDGNYRARLASRERNAEGWIPFQRASLHRDYVDLHVVGGVMGISLGNGVDLCDLSSNSYHYAGYPAACSVTLRNAGDTPAGVSFACRYDDYDGHSSSAVALPAITVAPRTTVQQHFTFTPSTIAGVSLPAWHKLVLTDAAKGIDLNWQPVYINRQLPSANNLLCLLLDPAKGADATVNPSSFTLTAILHGLTKGYTGDLYPALFEQTAGSDDYTFVEYLRVDNPAVSIASGTTAEVQLRCATTSAPSSDKKYYIALYDRDVNGLSSAGRIYFGEGASIDAPGDDSTELTVKISARDGLLTVESGSDIASLRLYTPSGAPVAVLTHIEGSCAKADVSRLSSGLYIIDIVSPSGLHTARKFAL